MLDKLFKYEVILASKSPRRQQLLGEIIPNFKVETCDVAEIAPNDLKRDEIAMYLSKLKSSAFRPLKNNELLITADTIVCINNEVLGKPSSHKEAEQMLQKLSNNTHTVYTGVTLRSEVKTITFCDATQVTFYPISLAEISYYIEKYNPLDKAGSYGIQEWLGYVKIKEMKGEFYNVMGLPLHRLYEVLKSW